MSELLKLHKQLEKLPITLHCAALLEILEQNPGASTTLVAKLAGYETPRHALWQLVRVRRYGFIKAIASSQHTGPGKPENEWHLHRKGVSALQRVRTILGKR